MVRTYLLNEQRKELFKDISSLSHSEHLSDVRFITKDGEVFGQKIVLLSAFPFLREWLCDFCIFSHEEISFVLPEVSKIEVAKALKKLDTNPCGLLYCFGFTTYVTEVENEESCSDNIEEDTTMVPADVIKNIKIEKEIEFTRYVEEDNNIKEQIYDKGSIEKWLRNDRKCEDCGTQRNVRRNLARHLKLNCPALGKVYIKKSPSNQQKGRFVCEECGKIYALRSSMLKHKVDMHVTQEDKLLEFFHCALCNFSCRTAA